MNGSGASHEYTTSRCEEVIIWRGALILSQDPLIGNFRGDAAVRDDRIVAVGDTSAFTAARVHGARGFALLPGFIDTHRHTWQTVLRGRMVGHNEIRHHAGFPSSRPT